ncbi:hypothetical protein [Streptomyces sp. cmx-10-25]|uniref:hypothetical protein n=1 Tax=Streptomyces sp. cmx-10-25 TaxID=2790919 RepID=UPI003980DF53
MIEHATGAGRRATSSPHSSVGHQSAASGHPDAIALTARPPTRKEPAEAAHAFERAIRSHTRAEQADGRALRSAARGIVRAGNVLGGGGDSRVTAMLLSTMVLVTIAAVHWHSTRGHARQAATARHPRSTCEGRARGADQHFNRWTPTAPALGIG